ncbi:MAG: HNH endonuclease [Marinifilaceae bacterium]
MKNLKPYSGNSIDLYSAAVARKRDGVVKDRLKEIENEISLCFDSYQENFQHNTLLELHPKGFVAPCKDDLLSLYDYDSFTIREFRKNLKKQQSRGVKSICQNCTIDSVGTLDHIVPKEEFPEFAVNPQNLFPCCSKCNSHKSDNWKDTDKGLFLNLYLDQLPKEQYLFVQIEGDDLDDIDFQYYLENRNGIDRSLFELIESHYTRLHLLERMNSKAVDEFDKLLVDIQSHIEGLSMEEVIQTVTTEANKLKQIYGYNHWLPVLKLAIIDNEVILESLGMKQKILTV